MEQENIIADLTNNVLNLCEPLKIILVSKKFNPQGELTSFKICVIVKDDIDTEELECDLYLKLECENPFDIFLYNISEWEEIFNENGSFANKIHKSGVVLYEA